MQLSARVFLILLSLMVVVTGCEKRVVEEPALVSFQLLSPVANSNVTSVDNLKVKIKYSGKASLATVYLELNGADITSEFASGNNVSDLFVADMAKLRSALVQGNNTLIASHKKLDINNQPVLDGGGNPVFDATYTFTFFFDDEAPRLTVDTVVPNAMNPDGTPLAGTSIDVTGKVIDASTVTSITFTYPGGNKSLLSVNTAVLGNNQFNSATGQYKVTLLNYPTVASATTVAHFSYTAKDSFKHTRTEQFMASGTAINQAAALQVNDTFQSSFSPFFNALVVNGYQKVKQFDVLGIYKPINKINGDPAQIGDLIENPFLPPVSAKRTWKIPYGKLPCTKAFIGVGVDYDYCVIYLTDVSLVNPSGFVKFSDRNTDMLAKLGMWVTHLGLDVTIALIKIENTDPLANPALKECEPPNVTVSSPCNYHYQSFAQGTIEWNDISMETDLIIKPGDSVNAINITREPFKWILRDLLKVPKITGTCDTCTNGISLAFLYEAFGGDVLQPANPPPIDPNVNCPSFQQPGNDISDKQDFIALGECAAEQLIGIHLDTFIASHNLPLKTIKQDTSGLKEIESELGVKNAYTVYNNNAHFVLGGKSHTDPAFYAGIEQQLVNGGLGSLFAAQGKYYSNLIPSIKGWPVTLAGQKNLDMSFAISANYINQWLLSEQQSGMLENKMITDKLTGADFVSANPAIDPSDQLQLFITTHEAPTVAFIAEDTSSASVCIGDKCTAVNKTSPGMVHLSIHNMDVILHNVTDSADQLAANINVDVSFELSVINDLPSVKISSDSLRVVVNSSTEPSDAVFAKTRLARNIQQGIELIVQSSAFKEIFQQRPTAIESVTALASIGCATPLPKGQLCISSSPVPLLYKNLFDDDGLVDGVFKSDIGVKVKWLTIEKGGSYLSVGLDTIYKQGGFSPVELQTIYMNYQITN